MFFSSTTGSNSIKLGTNSNILGQREFKFVQIKGQVLFKGGVITKMSKWGGVI
jgi:hypothetical protein